MWEADVRCDNEWWRECDDESEEKRGARVWGVLRRGGGDGGGGGAAERSDITPN